MAKLFLFNIENLKTASCALLLAITLEAAPQTKSVYGTVHSLEDAPVAQTEIHTDLGPSNVTTDSGSFEFRVEPPLQVGFPVIFYVTGWAIVRPCDSLARSRVYLPSPEAKEEIKLVAVKKGDKRLLERDSVGCIIIQKAAQFVRPRRPSPPTNLKSTVSGLFHSSDSSQNEFDGVHLFQLCPYAAIVGPIFSLPHGERYSLEGTKSVSRQENQDSADEYLQEQATELGFPIEQLSSAIKEWSESATDPYERGLAAYYERRYGEAIRLILESINASAQGPNDRYVALARAEYEEKNYVDARAALVVALAAHPKDPLLLQNLEAIDRGLKGASGN